MEERKITREPYMGQISASRVSGGNINLYGSSIQHHEIISITVTASETYRDWHSPKPVVFSNGAFHIEGRIVTGHCVTY